jgi:signal transduction histidine kinase/CheY-like chemotaxis protein/HAMP domain-containing protein
MHYQAFKLRSLTWVLLALLAILLFVVYAPQLIDEQVRLWQSAGVFISILVLIGGMLLVRRMNSRLERLAEVAEAIGSGRFDDHIDDTRKDSIGLVGAAVNEMADKIQDAVGRLEAQQRELVANRREVGIQHRRLQAEYERQAGFGKFLERLHSVEINTIARVGLDYMMTVAEADLGRFFLWDEAGEQLKPLYDHGFDREAGEALHRTDSARGLPEEVMRRRKTIVMGGLDGEDLPAIRVGLGEIRVNTLLGLPLMFREHRLGVVVLALTQPPADDKMSLVGAVQDALGNALNNARGYTTVQQQAVRLRHANQELVEADRLRSEFVANMSHELRTPLNSIIGFSTVLLGNRHGVLQERELGYAEKINRNGKHLLSLINDILDLSKIEAGRMDLEFRSTDLDGVCREIIDMLRPQAMSRQIELQLEIGDNLPAISTDSGKVRQVLVNLVGNAIKFTEQGSVGLKVACDGDKAVSMDVSDTGIGIPADKLETIFEPFRQADSGTTRRFGGTGLGLTISRSIVDLLGGRISVTSEEGKGTTFRVVLPLGEGGELPVEGSGLAVAGAGGDADHAAMSNGGAGAGDAGTHERSRPVLIVDDDRDARDLMSAMVEELGVPVVTADGGTQALQMAFDNPPRLITLDLMMDGMDGWEVLQRLKADPRTRDIPVVIVSIIADRRRAMVLGALEALTKPVVEQDLLAILSRLLDDRGAGRVLVVDDDADARSLVIEQIGERAGEIREAQDGRRALRVLEDFRPDLLFLDLMMPEMDGLSFLQEIRKDSRFVDTPVVIISAKTLTAGERTELDKRVVEVIEKGDAALESRVTEVVANALRVET